jgi:hypothetical protein
MTKTLSLFWLLLFCCHALCQPKIGNLLIITVDGVRWQEVFTGMDPIIGRDPAYNHDDSALIFHKYWSNSTAERRKMLLPFIWNHLAPEGQLYGNRNGSKVNTHNRYKFSYPGYNEIFTGYADNRINSNEYPPNPNTNLLEYLNTLPGYRGKIAAFGAWEAFDRILNQQRNKLPIFSAFDSLEGLGTITPLFNRMLQNSFKPFDEGECLDVFTHYAATEYLKLHHPKVLYIAYGEPDEWAHRGDYKFYLNSINQFDKWLGEIWNYIQNTPFYRNKTAMLITTDHGRGDKIKAEWTSHGEDIVDAGETWFALIGPGIKHKGEIKADSQYYQDQLAQTMASLLHVNFKANHPVGPSIDLQ